MIFTFHGHCVKLVLIQPRFLEDCSVVLNLLVLGVFSSTSNFQLWQQFKASVHICLHFLYLPFVSPVLNNILVSLGEKWLDPEVRTFTVKTKYQLLSNPSFCILLYVYSHNTHSTISLCRKANYILDLWHKKNTPLCTRNAIIWHHYQQSPMKEFCNDLNQSLQSSVPRGRSYLWSRCGGGPSTWHNLLCDITPTLVGISYSYLLESGQMLVYHKTCIQHENINNVQLSCHYWSTAGPTQPSRQILLFSG